MTAKKAENDVIGPVRGPMTARCLTGNGNGEGYPPGDFAKGDIPAPLRCDIPLPPGDFARGDIPAPLRGAVQKQKKSAIKQAYR